MAFGIIHYIFCLFWIVNAEQTTLDQVNSTFADGDEIKEPSADLQRNPFRHNTSALNSISDPSLSKHVDNRLSSPLNSTNTPLLQRRQGCSFSCSGRSVCYQDSRFTKPEQVDCNTLSNFLISRGGTRNIGASQQAVESSGTCTFVFTNTGSVDVTLCDSAWGSGGKAVTEACIGLTTEGTCTLDGLTLTVLRTGRDTGAPAPPSTGNNSGAATTTASEVSATSTSGSPNPSNSTSASLTVTGTTSIPLSVVSLPGMSVESNTNHSLGPSLGTSHGGSGDDQETTPKSIAAMAAGIAVGGAVIISGLALFLLWRRRRKQRMEKELIRNVAEQYTDPPFGGTQEPMSEALPFSSNRPSSTWPVPPKPAKARTSQLNPKRPPGTSAERFINGSSASVLGMQPQQENSSSSSSDPSSEPGTSPQQQPQQPHDSTSGQLTLAGRPVGQQEPLPPPLQDLSDQDIYRLADSILARVVQGTTNAPVPAGRLNPARLTQENGSALGTSEAQEDPPPPWRASWESDRQPVRPPGF